MSKAHYGDDDDGSGVVTATIERYDEGPDICTLHPVDPGDRVDTEWISAHTGSYLPLATMR